MSIISDYLHSNVVDTLHLLAFVLQKNSAYLYANPKQKLNDDQQKQLTQLIKKRQQGIPLGYLFGYQDFYHLRFFVNQDTLIPRADSEKLIDVALNLFNNEKKTVLDLGTGSGALAITLKHKRANWQIIASDYNQKTLNIAQKNSHFHRCKIHFSLNDWLTGFSHNAFDLIITNPPYISQNDPHLRALKHEPIKALVSGDDGLNAIKIIIKQAPKHLKKNAYLLLEHGYQQQAMVLALLRTDFKNYQCFQDLGQNPRCVLAQLK